MKFSKIEATEAAKIKATTGVMSHRVDLSEYVTFLQGVAEGELGRIALEPTDTKSQVRWHLELACHSINLMPTFLRAEKTEILFEHLKRMVLGNLLQQHSWQMASTPSPLKIREEKINLMLLRYR